MKDNKFILHLLCQDHLVSHKIATQRLGLLFERTRMLDIEAGSALRHSLIVRRSRSDPIARFLVFRDLTLLLV